MMAGGPFPSHKGGGSAEAWKDLSTPEAFTKAAGLHQCTVHRTSTSHLFTTSHKSFLKQDCGGNSVAKGAREATRLELPADGTNDHALLGTSRKSSG